MSDFETHPVGTGEELRSLRAALSQPSQPMPEGWAPVGVKPGIYHVSPSGKFIPHHCPAMSEEKTFVKRVGDGFNKQPDGTWSKSASPAAPEGAKAGDANRYLNVALTKDEAEYIAAFIADENEADDDVVQLVVGSGHSGFGLYGWHPEYQEEGSVLIKSLPEPEPLKAADEFELCRLLMEERETVRQLNRALRGATEAPTFMGEPVKEYGWLYDWTHSSALGKPDAHFTGFTKDEQHARKHENVRPVYTHHQPPEAAKPEQTSGERLYLVMAGGDVFQSTIVPESQLDDAYLLTQWGCLEDINPQERADALAHFHDDDEWTHEQATGLGERIEFSVSFEDGWVKVIRLPNSAALLAADEKVGGEAIAAWANLDPSIKPSQRVVFVAAEAEEADRYHFQCYSLTPLYTRPQQAAQVPLTREQINEMLNDDAQDSDEMHSFVRDVEAHHGIK